MSGISKSWPSAPNTYGAVVTNLPVLCGVLIAFSAGYFVAIIVAEWEPLSYKYTITPFLFPNFYEWKFPIERRIAIGIATMLSSLLLLVSMLSAVSAQMLNYDPATYDGKVQPNAVIKAYWNKERSKTMSRSLLFFHFSLPALTLSLVLLLDSWILTLSIYGIIFWTVNWALKAWREKKFMQQLNDNNSS